MESDTKFLLLPLSRNDKNSAENACIPIVIDFGDYNIHVDDATNDNNIKLCDILSTHDLQQHVNSSTHRQGHMLDLFVTRSDQLVDMLPIDPPLLSDHSFIIADLDYSTMSCTSQLSGCA